MAGPGHRSQLILFLAALLVPSAMLVVVSQRAIQQNRELAGKRRLDDQRAARQQAARDLLTRLEALRQSPVAGPDSPIALVATVENDHLLLPWETDARARLFHDLLREPRYSRALAAGEQAQYAAGDAAAGARHYRAAIAAAREPAQAAHARLLLARTLAAHGGTPAGWAEARIVLRSPAGLVDEDGVPLRAQAASLLLASPQDRDAVRDVLLATADPQGSPSPMTTLLLANIEEQIESSAPAGQQPWTGEFRARIAAAIRDQEQAQALQRDAARLGLLNQDWRYYPGAEPWLVSASAGRVIAVRARQVFQPVEAAGRIRLLAAPESGAELLGSQFPGLLVAFPPVPDADFRLQTGLYYTALLGLLGATWFGASILWRSLRREIELTTTRAQFVASVSHELKTPLTSIRMFAETLAMGHPLDEPARAEYLETIVNESQRLTRLVDDILLFSRLERGKHPFRMRPVALPDIPRAAARAIAYQLQQLGFELDLIIDESLPEIQADPDALGQAILNLLTNAMKYSGECRHIQLALRRQAEEAVIEVSDRGLGIAADQQARVFEKYYRVPSPENESIPGAGIGLALVAQIAEAHGGRVDLKSAPGAGSTFALRLPLGRNR